MMGLVIAITARPLSCGMSVGAGATTAVESPITSRRRSAEAFAGGGITELFSLGVARFSSRITSGGGATIAPFDKTGGVLEERNPSEGGGPGMGLSAIRFATAAVETGSFRFG